MITLLGKQGFMLATKVINAPFEEDYLLPLLFCFAKTKQEVERRRGR